jgi:hypothetical protein
LTPPVAGAHADVVRYSRWITFAVCALVAACGDDPEQAADDGISLSGISLTVGDSTGIDPSGIDSSDKLDVQGGATDTVTAGGDTTDSGCKKVDLLFVIDNSGSMADEQSNLVSSFPDLINGMRTTLSDTMGYNVGIISSDTYIGDFSCPLQDGNLITQTSGVDSSNSVCGPFSSGKRYMTEADDLETQFACAAQIGTSGDGNERPMSALVAALSPSLTDTGACNEGFLRDDALLVIVIITDEEDDHEVDGCMQDPQPGSPGEPLGWFEGVKAAKGGDESKVVVLSLVGPNTDPMCPLLDKCTGGIDGAEVAHRVIEFTEMFTYGEVESICEPYGPAFVDAIGVIKSACDEFEPQG